MAKKKDSVPETEELNEIRFRKSKILTFGRYRNRVDLLSALLQDDTEYTMDEVDSIMDNFMKGKVN